MRRSLPMYTRQFTCRFAERIANHYVRAITSEKSNIMKGLEKDDFTQLTISYEHLLDRNFVTSKQTQMSTTLKINLGATFLITENLQKRIQGIKIVNEEIKNLNRYQQSAEQTDVVMS